MSKTKINAAEIAELVAESISVNKRLTDDFLKVLVATIEESLMANDVVKIKGLGTFKLQWNEPRKSVDVNTGAEIIIDGYHKVVFTPEANLKELVNEPYSHLEAVVLAYEDDNHDSTADLVDADETPKPLKLFAEHANEIKGILSEINSLNKNEEEIVIEVPSVQDTSEEFQHKISNPPTKKKSNLYKDKSLSFFFMGIMVGGLLIYILIYFNVIFKIANFLKTDRTQFEAVLPYEGVSVVPDTVSSQMLEPSVDDELEFELNDEPVDHLQILFDQPRVYTEFIATEKVIQGSRLTRIAERHYGVKEFWVYIYEANMEQFTSPDQISPGKILKIPKLNPVLADKNNPRCLEYALKLHDLYLKK
ncbi:MAG: HU family DNA-binding protein [Paludibacter sp.]|nr:HU family DNA-binding protein [Paludibacter sp.]